MKQIEIVVKPRAATGSTASQNARRGGFVPAVVYGAGEPNAAVVVEEKALRAALRAGAAKSVVNLVWEDGKKATLAIVKETQFDALGEAINHVDFYRITADKPIHLTVPLVTRGHAKGESMGGILEHLTREVRIETLPTHIPDAITIDVTPMAVGDSFHLRDLPAIEGVRYVDAPETTLVALKASRLARAETEVKPEEAEAAAAAEGAEGEEDKEEKPEKPEKTERPKKK